MGYIGVPTTTDPEVLSTAALKYLMDNIPGYAPADGNLEVWMVMALAQMLATSRDVTAIVPDEIFEFFGTTIMNLPPIAASPSQVTATITVQDNAGYDIPAGTQFGFQVTGSLIIVFAVVNDTVIPPGLSTATGVILNAVVPGSSSNGLTGSMVTIDPLAFVTGITATTTSAGGVDAEVIGTYLSRLVSDLQLLAPRPILPGDFAVLARSIAGVYRALGIDGYNPGRVFTDGVTATDTSLHSATTNFSLADVGRAVTGSGIFAGSTISVYVSATQVTLSHVTTATATGVTITLGALTAQQRTVGIAAIDVNGNDVNGTIQGLIVAYLTSLREINFIVSFVPSTVTTINVVFAIHCNIGTNTTSVVSAVTTALQNYLSKATWGGGANNPPSWDPFASVVRYLSVAGIIEGVPGVNYLSTLTLNGSAADVTISGVAPLANYGTVSGSAV